MSEGIVTATCDVCGEYGYYTEAAWDESVIPREPTMLGCDNCETCTSHTRVVDTDDVDPGYDGILGEG